MFSLMFILQILCIISMKELSYMYDEVFKQISNEK